MHLNHWKWAAQSYSYCHVSADPFAALESEAPPPPAVHAAPPNLVDLDDMYTVAAPSQTPFVQLSSLDPTAGQNLQAPVYGAHMPQMPAATLQPPAGAQLHMPAQPQAKAPPVQGGPAPMAPRGNAAVEQQAGRKDPFADLFS